jgi:hypothetical protein
MSKDRKPDAGSLGKGTLPWDLQSTEVLLPYDSKRRCEVCGNLFNQDEWHLAYIGMAPGIENHVVIHNDCFRLVHQKKPLGRGLLPGMVEKDLERGV